MLSSMKKTQTRERFRPMDSTFGGQSGEEVNGKVSSYPLLIWRRDVDPTSGTR